MNTVLTQWPKDEQEELKRFYGRHELGDAGLPTERWESQFLTVIDVPYPLALSWEPTREVRRVRCHKEIASSLKRILESILKHYGSVEGVREARMNLFGGCYNFRRARGLQRLSTHAWGCAIDLDPERNGLGVKWNEKNGMMPLAVVKIFEDEGWEWGGRWARPDAMHFQAARS